MPVAVVVARTLHLELQLESADSVAVVLVQLAELLSREEQILEVVEVAQVELDPDPLVWDRQALVALVSWSSVI
jgi:hypothetical protein